MPGACGTGQGRAGKQKGESWQVAPTLSRPLVELGSYARRFTTRLPSPLPALHGGQGMAAWRVLLRCHPCGCWLTLPHPGCVLGAAVGLLWVWGGGGCSQPRVPGLSPSHHLPPELLGGGDRALDASSECAWQ
jgi:hypothetical protein